MRLFVVARVIFVCLSGVVIFGIGCWQRSSGSTVGTPSGVWADAPTSSTGWTREAGGRIPMPEGALAAHASNLVAMPASHAAALSAFWFAGDRESAPNVQIAASQWDRATQQWLTPRYVVNRHAMALQLGYGLRRLGNPVAWVDGDGRLHLFVVVTGLGGWAASRVLQLQQVSPGSELQELAFEPVRVLPLSWLWNLSYLVRNPPVSLDDGGMVLPAHFELGLKHANALRFDRRGNFLGLVRVSRHHDRLQPALVMRTPTNWLALMRVQREGGKIAVAQTWNAGRHWFDQPDLTLPNPDSAVAGIGLSSGQALIAYNPSDRGRTMLQLDQSRDGSQWTHIAELGKGEADDEFSYPSLGWSEGKLWVSYSVDRTHIEWQRFVATDVLKKASP